MRRFLGLATAGLLIAVVGAVSASFGTVIFSEPFDPSISPNTNITVGYSFGDTASSAITIGVGQGVGGTNSWETTNTTSNKGNGFSGVGAQYQHKVTTGNTSTNLSDYTLSFDAKSTGGSLNLQIETWPGQNFGGAVTGKINTAPANPGFGNDQSLNPQYTHYALNLGDTNVFQGNAAGFDPTGGTYQITFQFNGSGQAPFTQVLDVDNLTLTMKDVPEPMSVVLLGLAMPAFALIARRRRK